MRKRGRPAGFVLERAGRGTVPPREGKGRAAAVREGLVDLEQVVVTVEELRALRPRKAVSLFSRVVAVILHRLRVEAGMSQGELARRSRLTRQEIGQLEHCEHGVKLETLRALCVVLRVRAGSVVDLAERWAARGWQV